MAGLTDYTAENLLQYVTGNRATPALPSVYVGLFTTAPTSDSGVTGATEVSGGSYARIQVAGALALSASFTTSSSTLTLAASAPAWLTALGTNGSNVNVYDATNSQQIGTVSSVSGTTVTLTGNALHASSGSADSIVFSAFPAASASTGSEPSTTPANVANAAIINFGTATANWGTVVAFGLFDALTSGNCLAWDYLGNYKWIPFSCTNASPGVITCDSTSDAPANSSSIVVTAKFGGTLPSTAGSWAGILTTANLSGATFTAGVNTTGIGGGQFRQVQQLAIGNGIGPVTFAASALILNAA